MKLARWLLPLLSLALVLLVTWWDLGGERQGPGPLHPAHARVPELAMADHCDACHRRGAGVDASACTRCHAAIGAQQAKRQGLHGRLAPADLQRCGACHGEHHGDAVALIAPHAFARAGIPDANSYDHRDVAFQLRGAHTALACERCHPQARASEPPAGGRFLGASQRCTSCHEDPHRQAYGDDCASCHGQEQPWKAVPLFPHEVFPLDAAHAKVACAACHAEGTEHAVVALRAAKLPARTCAECHANPHGASDRPATALRLAGAQDCARCHEATEWTAARRTAAEHAVFGFVLRGAHATAACAACHGDATRPVRWREAAPELAACGACHDQPHAAELLAAATAALGPADGCGGCHRDADQDFRAGTMSPALHRATGMPLEAPHAEVACGKCHEGEGRASRFPGRTAADCRACHRDVHGGQFAADVRYQQCTACHDPTRFRPARFGIEAHAATAFPLTGAHDAVACHACHRQVEAGVRAFHGTPGECAGCHEDVHRGQFDRPGRPRDVEGRTGCQRCHDTRAFTPWTGEFAHAVWTGFELTGAHVPLACAACHARATTGAAAGRFGAALGTRCADCHHDPHAGQFAASGEGGTECARCHDATAFRNLHFDHQKSRFPLDAQHAAVACAKCHATYRTDQGPVVRYRPLGTACGDCHRVGGGPEGRK